MLIAAWFATAGLDGQGLSISSVSGVWNHKSTLTITGTGFGTKSTAPPVVWDDSSATSITDKWSGGWPDNSNNSNYNIAYRTPIRGVNPPHQRVGRYIAGAHGESNGYNAGYNVMVWKSRTVALPAKLYVSFYYRQDPLWMEHSTLPNNKMFDYSRGGEPYNLDPAQGANWYAEYYVAGGGHQWHLNDDKTTSPRNLNESVSWYGSSNGSPVTAWRKIEIFNTYSKTAGGVLILQDGVTVMNYSGSTDNMPSTDRTDAIGGFERITSSNAWRYFTDIYLDYSFAHVILGNKSTYSTSTVREPQIPTAWSSSSITISANLGTFSAGQTVYLYVMDGNGTVNQQGFPITVGSGSAAPPAAPANLRIQ